jgi:hypothetical protein
MDLQKFFGEDLGITDAEALDAILKGIPKEAAEKLEKSVLRQADYSQKMDGMRADIETQQGELAAASERLTAEIAEWGKMTAAEKAKTTTRMAEFEAGQKELLKTQQALRRLAETAGVDPKTLVDSLPDPKKDTQAPMDLSGVVRTEDFTKAINNLAEMSVTLPAELHTVAQEHFALTGQYLDTRELVTELKARAARKGNTRSLEPRDIWEEKYNIAQVRKTAADKVRADELDAARRQGYEDGLSQTALPGSHPPARHSPVLLQADGAQRTSILQRPQPGTSLQTAILALQTGKYRGSGESKPA